MAIGLILSSLQDFPLMSNLEKARNCSEAALPGAGNISGTETRESLQGMGWDVPEQEVLLCLSAWAQYGFGSSGACCLLLNFKLVWETENRLPVWHMSNVHRIPGIVLLFSATWVFCVKPPLS